MSPTEYREAIAALSLTQGEAAAFLGVSRRSSAGWATGEHPSAACGCSTTGVDAQAQAQARRSLGREEIHCRDQDAE